MKKVVFLFVLFTFALVIVSCSDAGKVQGPAELTEAESQFVRPPFIDNRTDAEKELVVLRASDSYLNLRKKPVKPDPEPEELVDPNPNPANKYALIIGISDYDGTQNDLQYCDDDAYDWQNYLQDEGFDVQMLVDGNATSSNITTKLEWLSNAAVAGDEIAFIYSGHGADYGTGGSSIISSDLYYVTHDFVMEYISSSNCTKKLIAIDACEIGDFHDNLETSMIIATASDRSYSYDGESWMQNGAWTYYYIESLVTNDAIFNEIAMEYTRSNMKTWGRANHLRVTPKNSDAYAGAMDI